MAGTEAPPVEAEKEETRAEVPSHLRDELLLKFVGTATLLLGVVLLISSSIGIAVLSILKFDLGPWLPVLPLSLLVILIGGLVNVYFRNVIDRAMNPKKYEAPPRSPIGYAYSPAYAMPPPYYAFRMPNPPGPAPRPATAPQPATPPMAVPGPTRFCIMCGKRIPAQAKFCPYCRHAYSA